MLVPKIISLRDQSEKKTKGKIENNVLYLEIIHIMIMFYTPKNYLIKSLRKIIIFYKENYRPYA